MTSIKPANLDVCDLSFVDQLNAMWKDSSSLAAVPNFHARSMSITSTSTNTAASTTPSSPLSPPPTAPSTGKRSRNPEDREARRQARIVRNRQAAQYSRDKKRQYVEQLEANNASLQARLSQVEAEKDLLMSHLRKLTNIVNELRDRIPESTSTKPSPSAPAVTATATPSPNLAAPAVSALDLLSPLSQKQDSSSSLLDTFSSCLPSPFTPTLPLLAVLSLFESLLELCFLSLKTDLHVLEDSPKTPEDSPLFPAAETALWIDDLFDSASTPPLKDEDVVVDGNDVLMMFMDSLAELNTRPAFEMMPPVESQGLGENLAGLFVV
ncbi:hypothetical protein HDV05_006914 [Chytridiales sp. JEL 0842]|nr:hypothetical protein HDV05_006914 [Chytridiales sp. JEL 0842]